MANQNSKILLALQLSTKDFKTNIDKSIGDIGRLDQSIQKLNNSVKSNAKIDLGKIESISTKIDLLANSFKNLQNSAKIKLNIENIGLLGQTSKDLKALISQLESKGLKNISSDQTKSRILEENQATKKALQEQAAIRKRMNEADKEAQKQANELIKQAIKIQSMARGDVNGIAIQDYSIKLTALISKFEKLKQLGLASGTDPKGAEQLEKQIKLLSDLQRKLEETKKNTIDLTKVSDKEDLTEKLSRLPFILETLKKLWDLIGDAVKKAAEEALKFEQRVYQMRTVTGNDLGDFQGSARTALKAAEEVGASAISASQGIQTVVAAGVNAADSVRGYQSALMAAKSTQSDFSDLIKAAIIIQNNYADVTVDDWDTIFNKISIAAKRSKADVSDFAKQIPSLVSAFATAGIGLDDTLALFSSFNNSMRNASESSVAAVALLTKLQKPTVGMVQLLDKINNGTKGIGDKIVFSASAIGGDLEGFLANFKAKITAFAKDKSMNVGDIINNMFRELRSSKGMTQALKAVFTGAFGDIKKHLEDDTKDLQQSYEEAISSMLDRWEMFSNQVSNGFKSMFVSVQPTLQDLINWLDGALNSVIGFVVDLVGEFAYLEEPALFMLEMFKAVGTVLGLLVKNIFILIGDIVKVLASAVNIIIKSVEIIVAEIMVIGKTLYNLPDLWRKAKAGNISAITEFFDAQIKTVADKGQDLRDEISRFSDRVSNPDVGFTIQTKFDEKRNYTGSSLKPGEAKKEDYNPISDLESFGRTQLEDIEKAEKFKSEIDKIQDDILKNTLSKYEYETKSIKKEYDQRVKDLNDSLENEQVLLKSYSRQRSEIEKEFGIDKNTSKQFAKTQNTSILPSSMPDIEKKRYDTLISKITFQTDKLKGTPKNGEIEATLGLEKEAINALSIYKKDMQGKQEKADKEEKERIKSENEKADRERKQVIEEQYDIKINKLNDELNAIETQAKKAGLTKAQTFEKTQAKLIEIAKAYEEKSAKYGKSTKEGSGAFKESTAFFEKIEQIKADIKEEYNQKQIKSFDKSFDNEKEKLKKLADLNGLSTEQQINNDIALSKSRIKNIDLFLAKNKFSAEQIEKYNQEKKSLQDQIDLDRKKRQDESFKNSQEREEIKINTELENIKTLAATGLKSDEDVFNAEIKANNARIKLAEESKKRTKDPTEQAKIEAQITSLKNSNTEIEFNKEQAIFDKKQKLAEDEINLQLEVAQTSLAINKSNESDLLKAQILANNALIEEKKKALEREKKLNNPEKQKAIKNEITSLSLSNVGLGYQLTKIPETQSKADRDKLFNYEVANIQNLLSLRKTSEEQSHRDLISLNEKYLEDLNKRKVEIEEKNTGGRDTYSDAIKQEYDTIVDTIRNSNLTVLQENLALNDKLKQDDLDYLQSKLDIYSSITKASKALSDSLINSSSQAVKALGRLLGSFGDVGSQGLDIFSQANNFQIEKDTIRSDRDNLIPYTKDWKAKNTELSKVSAQESAASTAQGLQMAAQEVSKSIATIIQNYEKYDKQNQKVTQTIKVFGEGSTQAKEAMMGLNETFSDSLKMIPIFGDILASATRAITDFFGATVSEKDKKVVQDLEDATNHLTKVRLENGAKTLQNELAILEQEKKENLQNLVDKGLDNKAFEIERLSLVEEFAAKRLKVEKDYYAELVKTQQDLEFAQMGIQKGSYENQGRQLDLNYQNKISEIRDKYNPSGEEGFVPSDAQLNEEEAAYLNYLTDRQSLTASEGKKELDINYDNQKSLIELQDDGYNKSIELLEIDIAKRKALVEEDFKEGVISRIQGNRILETIDREYQASLKKINDDYKDKIRAFNEKSYTAELSVIDKFYGEKRRKLEQDVQHEIDARKDLKQKLKDIDEEREQDQELKEKRAVEFQKALSSQSKGGDFYRIANPENFQSKYGTERNQVQDSFDLGTGNYKDYDKYAKKRQELGVSTYQYYSYLAENETDSAKKDEYLRQAKAGADEFYEFIFDKSKESIENEIKASTKREADKRAELLKTTDLEKAEIAKLDKAYKDSSGLYKDSFVQATQVWTKFAQDAINDIDLSNLIGKVKNDIAEIQKDASKLGGSGVTPSSSSPSSPPSSSTPAGRDTSTTPKANETWDQMIARFKAEDAAVTIANRKANGQAVPVYEQGTPFVPETGLAILHKGEMIVPASINSDLMNRGYTGFLANRAANNNYSTSSVNNSNQQTIIVKNEVVIQGNDTNQMRAEFNKFESKLTQQLTKLGIK